MRIAFLKFIVYLVLTAKPWAGCLLVTLSINYKCIFVVNLLTKAKNIGMDSKALVKASTHQTVVISLTK